MNNNLEQENDFLKQCLKIYVEGCEERQQKIDKAIELIKRSAGYKGIFTQPETDTFSKLLEILGVKK